MITEVLQSLGDWEIRLADNTPQSVLEQVGFFGHIAVIPGPVDVEASGDALLDGARYVGVLHGRTADKLGLTGEGLIAWLGDEDGKGDVIEAKVTLTNATLDAAVTVLLPASVAKGTVHPQPDGAQRYTGTFQLTSRRQALDTVADTFNVEYRLRGRAVADFGTQADLYQATPTAVIRRTPVDGNDMDLVGVDGVPTVEEQVRDFSTRVVLVGETEEAGVFATGAVGGPDSTYLDIRGNPLRKTRLVSSPQETTTSVQAVAQLNYNRFHRIARTVRLASGEYQSERAFAVGDNAYVYDPQTGIVDPARDIDFRGERIWPDVVRVSEHTWPVTDGHTVGFRSITGVWTDLTPYVTWETGQGDVVVGDLPASLQRKTDDPLAGRVDTSRFVPNTVAPKAPTGLTLASTAAPDAKGNVFALVSASWTPPTQNTDNTPLTDLAYYAVQYRWTGRAPLWQEVPAGDTSIDLPATLGLVYEVQVAAVDSQGQRGPFTGIQSITAAVDTTGPATPSTPILEPYFGLLRIKWDGLTSTAAAMPADFQRVDVHVSATTGFTPSAATLKASSTTGGIVGHVDAPYGATRYVKLIAYDRSQNPSTPSAQVSGATVQVNDGDIQALNVGKLTSGIVLADITISGRFATALTGARREMNALGFQAFDASNALLINLDGVNNLLTGIFQTALTGRRISLGTAGKIGEVTFTAPDGTEAFIRAYTEGTGIEAVQFGVRVGSANSLWNRINYNTDEYANYRAGTHEFIYRDTEAFHVLSNPNPQNSPTPSGSVERLGLYNDYSAMRSEDSSTEVVTWNDHIDLTPGDIDLTGKVVVEEHGISDSNFRTPSLQFWTDNNNVSGAGYYVGRIKYIVRTGGVNPAFQFRDTGDTTYQDLEASAFTLSSSSEGKRDITTFTDDALLKIRSTRVTRFRRAGPRRAQPDVGVIEGEGAASGEQLGLIAEEVALSVPEILSATGDMINLGSQAALQWKATQELADLLDDAISRLVAVERRRP